MTITKKMSLVTSVIAITLLIINLPTEIGCCSLTTYEAISLMSHNPDFRNDPCYIEWEASQNTKLSHIWTQREQLEKTIADHNRKRMEYERQLQENRHRSYHSSSVPKKKETSVWKVLGILVGIMVSIACFAFCVAVAHSDRSDANPPTITNNRQSEPLSVPLASVVAVDTNANDFTNLIASPTTLRQQPVRTNVQLMPTRQDSLPSYEDAVKMPSAPTEQ